MTAASALLLAALSCAAQEDALAPTGSESHGVFVPASGGSEARPTRGRSEFVPMETEDAKKKKVKNKKPRRERAPRGSGGADGPPEPSEPGEASEPTMRTSEAAKKAERMADALKSSLPTPDAEGAAARASGDARPAAAAPSAANPAKPTNERELRLSAAAGYGDAFKKVGLQLGRAPDGSERIVEKDGTPATPARLEELRLAVRAEPKSLMRRPDFFGVLPREQYAALKSAYQEKPELKGTVFKDVVLSKRGRDFRWSDSCDMLSGGCNPAAERSYKKGENPSPEELKRMYDALAGGGIPSTDGRDAAAVARAKSLASPGWLETMKNALAAAIGGEGAVLASSDGRPREGVAVGPPSAARLLDRDAPPSPEPPVPTRALWPWLIVLLCVVAAWTLVRRT